jgi:hypothetical protein
MGKKTTAATTDVTKVCEKVIKMMIQFAASTAEG